MRKSARLLIIMNLNDKQIYFCLLLPTIAIISDKLLQECQFFSKNFCSQLSIVNYRSSVIKDFIILLTE